MPKAKKETQSRKFSIYLLKDGYLPDQSLKEEVDLTELSPEDYDRAPTNAKILILKKLSSPPWWKDFFGIKNLENNSNQAAIVFLPIEISGNNSTRWFALCFGHSKHCLKKDAYEYDFGMLVTLNCVDPQAIRSLDINEPEKSKNKRTQVPAGNDITYLDFNQDTSIIKSLTGKIKEDYKKYFTSATGATSLGVSMDTNSEDLLERCKFFYEMYNKNDYKKYFPNIDNIQIVKDPVIIEELDNEILKAFNKRNDGLQFSIPFLIDNEGEIEFSFSKKSTRREYIYIGDYYEHLKDKGILKTTIESLNKAQVFCFSEESLKDTFSIYECLIFETKLENKTYYLSGGRWYNANDDFVANLDAYLDQEQLKYTGYNFIDFNDSHKNSRGLYSETEYNKKVAGANSGNMVLLDGKNIAPAGTSQVEPCDLYLLEDNNNKKHLLFHIKRHTGAQGLSHLFSQGSNAAYLLISSNESREKMNSLLAPKGNIDKDFAIVFGIITRKDIGKVSENLPLFSKLSLRRNLDEITSRKIDAYYCFIKDTTTYKKTAPIKTTGAV